MTTPDHIADYVFKEPALLREALTHPSLNRGESYQRLEFLGDRVLGLTMAEALFSLYPHEAEGALNRRLSDLVRRETVAEVALALGLDRLLLLTESADQEGTRTKPSALGDVGEAVIGAIYRDGGFDAARSFILHHWQARLASGRPSIKDAKTELQEWAQGQGLPLPLYEVVSRTGPDHEPRFLVRVQLDGSKNGSRDRGRNGNRTAKAGASSKRAAEQAAAAALLEALASPDDDA